jgi:Spy/CpxP family protein refolding chaperone
MKKSLVMAVAACFGMLVSAPNGLADGDQASPSLPKTGEDVEAGYTRAIEGRTTDILALLEITNPVVKVKVHDIIMAQYRSLRAWHDVNDAKLKAARSDTNATAQIRRSLKSVHDEFIAKLSAYLTPEQVEKVKDKMTYGKVQFTYAGYLAAYPDLTEENKQKIFELLKQAREEAMDGGSSDEKTAIFQRYKGKINNYLSKQGIHPAKKKAAKPAGDK